MNKHTPGPWWNSHREVGTHPRMDIKICVADGANYGEALANARLIAAAPQLLMALEDAITTLQPLAEQLPSIKSRCEGYSRIVRLARPDEGPDEC